MEPLCRFQRKCRDSMDLFSSTYERKGKSHPSCLYRVFAGSWTILKIFAFAAVVIFPAAVSGYTKDQVRIGVLAKRGKEQCLIQWGPTAGYLSETVPLSGSGAFENGTQKTFVIVPLAFHEVFSAVEKRTIDFILANPAIYVEMESRFGTNRIATRRERSFLPVSPTSGKHKADGLPGLSVPGNLSHGFAVFGGVIFTRKDHPEIRRLQDIKAKKFMAVDETSFGGWLAGWRRLDDEGIVPEKDFAGLAFGGTHDAVVYAVSEGIADAGTVRTGVLEQMAAEGRIRMADFRVFGYPGNGREPETRKSQAGMQPEKNTTAFPFVRSTRLYPEWPLAALSHTPANLSEKVLTALLSMPGDHPGDMEKTAYPGKKEQVSTKPGNESGWTIPLNYQSVHECLKQLRVGPYENLGKVRFSDVLQNYWKIISAFLVLFFLVTLFAGLVFRLNRRLNLSHIQLKEEMEEKKQAEKELKAARDELEQRVFARTRELSFSERKYRRIFESSMDMILIVDTHGKVLDMNPKGRAMLLLENTAFSEEQMDFSGLFARPGDAQAIFRKLDEEGMVMNLEVDMKRQDNTFFRALISGTNDPGPSEKESIIQFLVKDVEDLKRLETRMAQADKLASIGQLSAGIAHEINNPLGIILGYAQLLLRKSDLGPQEKEDMKTIEKHVRNCKLIIEDLLNFSRSSKPDTPKKPADIHALLDEVIHFVRHHPGGDRVRITRQYGKDIPHPVLDGKKIRQVFINLVMNARHAVGEDGEIGIHTGFAQKDGLVEVVVQDNGYGIMQENINRIFDPFFTTKSTGEGTGLGLSVSYGIIREHGGEITVESREGKGAVFRVFLPVSRKNDEKTCRDEKSFAPAD